jgi:hypothetical protein
MDQAVKIWILGGVAFAFGIASLVFSVLLAISLTDILLLNALQILFFVSAGLGLVALGSLAYFTLYHVRILERHPYTLTSTGWWLLVYGGGVAATALGLTGASLVWAVARLEDLPKLAAGRPPMILIGLGFGAWGVTLALQLSVYVMLGIWTRKVLKTQAIGRLDLDFGIRVPQMDQVRPQTQDTQRTFSSHDLTLHSPPQTPTSKGLPSSRQSSATRVGTSSSRIKLVKGSARSSLDTPAFPAGEAISIDSAFDDWDTSSVHRELRMVAMSSSPPTRSGLETIPGSRPESPEDPLDGPFLPPSPTVFTTPNKSSTDISDGHLWHHTSLSRRQDPTPPSSPPNFSRPASAQRNKPLALGSALASLQDSPMQDLIHPLFRPNSPDPPPNAVMGSMVTASPIANEPITPKALARLRSTSQIQHWKSMPSIDDSKRPSTAGSVASSIGFGSPGPSIVDEEEYLPPTVLPGFVMSAGQRSSLVGYGKRKSVKKERRQSQLSFGSRLSQVM